MNAYNKIINDSDQDINGKHFEKQVFYALKTAFRNNKDYKVKYVGGTRQDKQQGTDIIVEKFNPDTKKYELFCKLDPTIHFDGKSSKHTLFPMDTKLNAIRSAHETFKLGIRYGVTYKDNKTQTAKYSNFEIPVVIIGFDIDNHTYNVEKNAIEDNLDYYAKQLVELANEHYEKHKNYNYQKNHPDVIQKSINDLNQKIKENEQQASERSQNQNTQKSKPQNTKPKEKLGYVLVSHDSNGKSVASNFHKRRVSPDKIRQQGNNTNKPINKGDKKYEQP